MNSGFRVRCNETREFVDGIFCLYNNGDLSDDTVNLTSPYCVNTTHTACFPVGETDKNGDDIYEGDKLKHIDNDGYIAALKGASCERGITNTHYVASWGNLDTCFLVIIPPTPEPKVLTWPELEDGTFFKFTGFDGAPVVYKKTGDSYQRIEMLIFGTYRDFDRKDEPVTIVTPTWKEVPNE